ncbi:MAG: CBS domain-containing protein [Candidatus Methanomethylophilaceae archaeon]|jgi:predicted transcriptional regulator
MNFPPESDIRKMRSALGITQFELAKESGISQSTIAKIETEKTKASYETVARLFNTLERIGKYSAIDRTAADVASYSPITVNAEDGVKMASELMRNAGISQLPVMDGGRPVGSISERMILNLIEQGMSMEELRKTPVRTVMGESFPVVSGNTSLSTVALLMNDNDAVLVSKRGKIISVITGTDLLKLI